MLPIQLYIFNIIVYKYKIDLPAVECQRSKSKFTLRRIGTHFEIKIRNFNL